MQVRLSNVVPTAGFADVFESSGEDPPEFLVAGVSDSGDTDAEMADGAQDATAQDDPDDDAGGGIGGMWMLGLLPLLFLLG